MHNFQCTWVFLSNQMPITLAVEDAVSEIVAKRLLHDYCPEEAVTETLGNQGIGYIRRRIRDLNQIALYQNPVLVLADLDRRDDCAPNRVFQLKGRLEIAPALLIRVAVLEIESWILADREGIAEWLGVALNVVPRSPETLEDPKRVFVQLASRSRRRYMREGMSPSEVRGTHRTGPDYNEMVSEFVALQWNPEAARYNSPSLDRAINRISELGDP